MTLRYIHTHTYMIDKVCFNKGNLISYLQLVYLRALYTIYKCTLRGKNMYLLQEQQDLKDIKVKWQ